MGFTWEARWRTSITFPVGQTPDKFTYHRFWTFAFVPCWYKMRYIDVKNGYVSSHFLEEFYTERTCFGCSFTNGVSNTFHLGTEYIKAVRYLLKLYRDTRENLEADKSTYSSLKYWKLLAVSTFEALVTVVILLSLTTPVAANVFFKNLLNNFFAQSVNLLFKWLVLLLKRSNRLFRYINYEYRSKIVQKLSGKKTSKVSEETELKTSRPSCLLTADHIS